jgi:hypothetical protein
LDFDFLGLGLDLGECCWGPDHIGVRRIRDLISQLGPDSAIAREMGWSWDDMREMTATLIEVAVNKRRKKGTTPYKVPRPKGLWETARSASADAEPLTRAGVRAAFMTPGG